MITNTGQGVCENTYKGTEQGTKETDPKQGTDYGREEQKDRGATNFCYEKTIRKHVTLYDN